MSLYQLKHLTKSFGSRMVLSIEELEIQAGLIYALLGPNGAGKTTLINILGFLDTPSNGQFFFDGTPVDYSKNRLKSFRRNVVVVSQRPVLFTTSVYKNMEFGLKIRGIPKSRRHAIIGESLELVGMKHLINAPAVKLSGGETQRVVLARALALSPRIIICDEPTSSVDLESQIAVMDLLRTINREKGITIILSSHDRLQSTRLAHHVLFLDHGRLFDAAYENMFPFQKQQTTGGKSTYTLNDNLQLELARDLGEQGRVLLDPWKIELKTKQPDSNITNLIEGEVIQIIREKETVRLVLNSTLQLVTMMSLETYQTQKPMVGDKVIVRVTDEAVRII